MIEPLESDKAITGCIKRARAILPAFVVISILFFLPVIPASIVVSSKNLVLFEQIIDDSFCEIVFRHSANKGLVREVYLLSASRCMLTLHTAYNQSFGAGMTDTLETVEGLNFRSENGWFVLDFPAEWRSEINYIGGDIAGHQFIYKDNVIRLGELYSQKPFTLSVEKRSIIGRLLKLRRLF